MSAFAWLGIGAGIIGMLFLWRAYDRAEKHRRWRNDIDRREWGKGVDGPKWTWPYQ